MSVLGDRLRISRERKGYNQVEVSIRIKINNRTLSRYELGGTEPDVETLKELANLYEVSIDYLVGRTDDPTMTKKEQFKQIIDLSDDKIIQADWIYDNKLLQPTAKKRALRIIQEVLRIEVQEEDY